MARVLLRRSAMLARTAHAPLWTCLLLAVACSDDGAGTSEPSPEHPEPPADQPEPEPVDYEPLDAVGHLNRASMAFRGVRPNAADLARVEADSSALEAVIDEYLGSEAFGQAIRDLHNEALLVRVAPAIYPAGFPAVGALAGMESQSLNRDLVEAPLKLIEHVVLNDLPYSEIVTADYTLANQSVATVWGLSYTGGGDEWVATRWEDGRASAGILSDSMLFTRHGTTFSNANRGRANAISRALLCYDFLSREVAIDSAINLADPDEVNDAVRENDACASCHQTLDPLASYFDAYHPIYVPSNLDRYPVPHFLPTLETAIEIRPSAYFGEPGEGLDFLGAMIASDPRFSLCAARRFYAYFNQVSLSDVPANEAGRLQQIFIDSGLNAKALAKAVVLSDDFRASHQSGSDEPGDSASDVDGSHTRLSGLRKIRPWQLAALVEDLTGFRWRTELPVDIGSGTIGAIDLMTDGLFGFEVLAGGIDSMNVTLPSHTTSASVSLVLRALAARASEFVVENDFAESNHERRRLLNLVSEATLDEATVRAQLAELEARIFGRPTSADSPEVGDAYALFQVVLGESDDPVRAWQAVIYALLQDIRVAYY